MVTAVSQHTFLCALGKERSFAMRILFIYIFPTLKSSLAAQGHLCRSWTFIIHMNSTAMSMQAPCRSSLLWSVSFCLTGQIWNVLSHLRLPLWYLFVQCHFPASRELPQSCIFSLSPPQLSNLPIILAFQAHNWDLQVRHPSTSSVVWQRISPFT